MHAKNTGSLEDWKFVRTEEHLASKKS